MVIVCSSVESDKKNSIKENFFNKLNNFSSEYN